jgi:hypothetical protein
MVEVVYILINQAMPGYVKIGMTTQDDLEVRVRQLDNTSAPLPFEVYYAAQVPNARKTESLLHDAFMDYRVRPNREFFEVDPARVTSALKLAEIHDVTPTKDIVNDNEDQKALEKARSRGATYNFEMVDVPVGAELSFIRDESIKVRVVSKNKIEYLGEVYSLSGLALKLMQERYGWIAKTLNGWPYWLYEGESLSARSQRYAEGNA